MKSRHQELVPVATTRAARRLVVAALGVGVLACAPVSPSEVCDSLDCAPCAPAMSVRLTAAGGGAVQDVSIEGEEGVCQSDPSATLCSLTRGEPGLYVFTLTSPGFAPVAVDETVVGGDAVGCCACGYTPKRVERTAESS